MRVILCIQSSWIDDDSLVKISRNVALEMRETLDEKKQLCFSETDEEKLIARRKMKINSLRRCKVRADHGWEDSWALCSINSLVKSDEQHVHDDRAHRCRLFLKWIDRGSSWIESRYNNNTELSNRFIICLFGRRIIGKTYAEIRW